MLKGRVAEMLQLLNIDLYERETAVQLTLLTTLAGESIFLLGRPGVAKSLLARRIKELFKEGESFEYLMNRFSTPDELFGPIAISKLKNEDKYERKIEKYLPQADIVFLDEIWKAGPSIQNALLTVINEKIYKNGTEVIKIPLKVLVAASNELPAKNEGLEALWDRFIVRYVVNGIQDERFFNDYLSKSTTSTFSIPSNLKIASQEFDRWQIAIDEIEVSQEALNIINALRHYILKYNQEHNEAIYISDRRWKKIIRLLKTSAYFNDRNAIDIMDCTLIVHAIWNEENQRETVNNFLVDAIRLHSYDHLTNTTFLENAVDAFSLKVAQATTATGEETYLEPITQKEYNKEFYELEHAIDRHRRCVIITLGEYAKINYDSQVTVTLENSGYNSYNRITEQFKVRKISEARLEFMLNEKHNDLVQVDLKSKKTKRSVEVRIRPNDELLEQLNSSYKNIIHELDLKLDEVKSLTRINAKNFSNNIFVPNHFVVLASENLQHYSTVLKSLKGKVQSIRKEYESI